MTLNELLARYRGAVVLGSAVLAVLVRLILVAAFAGARAPVTYEYEGIADNILAGRGFLFPHLGQEYLSMRPLFVYLCVAVYWLTAHSHLAMLVVQALVAAGTVLVTFHIGSRLGGPGVAALAAVVVAVEPALVYYDVTRIHPLGLQTLLLSLLALAFLQLLMTPHRTAFILAGFAAGTAIYERGTPILFAPLGLAFIGFRCRMPLIHWTRRTVLFGLAALLVLAPWLVRNSIVYGQPVVVMTATPEMLWVGNNPNATGTLVTDSGQPMFDAAPAAFRARIFASDELGQQRLFWDEFRRFLTTQPAAAAILFVRKLYYFWWFSPQSGREHPRWAVSIYQPLYAIALLAAMWGFRVGFRRENRERFVLLLLFLAGISLGQSVFFVEGRHRLAVMPLVLLLGIVGAVDLLRRRVRPDGRCSSGTGAGA